MSLRTSPIYLAEVERLGREALERGLEQGLEQGRIAGERNLVLKLLNRKLDVVSPELIARVNSLNVERVEALGEALLDFNNMGDLEAWLN
jgi:predicted transposase YdaD